MARQNTASRLRQFPTTLRVCSEQPEIFYQWHFASMFQIYILFVDSVLYMPINIRRFSTSTKHLGKFLQGNVILLCRHSIKGENQLDDDLKKKKKKKKKKLGIIILDQICRVGKLKVPQGQNKALAVVSAIESVSLAIAKCNVEEDADTSNINTNVKSVIVTR